MNSINDPEMLVAYARTQWEEGEQRVSRCASDSLRRETIERVVSAVMAELEKRIGQTFSTAELAQLQDDAEQWALQVAHETAPKEPYAWDLDLVLNAAFHRYARRASDYQLSMP